MDQKIDINPKAIQAVEDLLTYETIRIQENKYTSRFSIGIFTYEKKFKLAVASKLIAKIVNHDSETLSTQQITALKKGRLYDVYIKHKDFFDQIVAGKLLLKYNTIN